MKRFQLTIDCQKIKQEAIRKAKEISGNDINKAIKFAKMFYKKLLELAMCPIIDCKTLLKIS